MIEFHKLIVTIWSSVKFKFWIIHYSLMTAYTVQRYNYLLSII